MKQRSVRVDVRSETLRRVLLDRMKDFPGLSTSGTQLADIVLSTTADATPEDCAELAEAGAEVVVLATVPSSEQSSAYESAGARYLPMSGNAELFELLEALQSAC